MRSIGYQIDINTINIKHKTQDWSIFETNLNFLIMLQSRLRGPSREPSFDDDRESQVARPSQPGKSRTTTYISSSTPAHNNNSVKIEVKDAKKSVPPSPAIKKKVMARQFQLLYPIILASKYKSFLLKVN